MKSGGNPRSFVREERPARPVRGRQASDVHQKLAVLREFQEFREFRSEFSSQGPGPQATVH